MEMPEAYTEKLLNHCCSDDQQQQQYLQVRVFCVRLRSCQIERAPEFLTLYHCSGDSSVVSGKGGVVSMRRNRVDKQLHEVCFVSTGCVLAADNAWFKVYCNDGLLASGRLQRFGLMWKMDCFVGSAPEQQQQQQQQKLHPRIVLGSPNVEFSVAGHCDGYPVFLTQRLRSPFGYMNDKLHEWSSFSGMCGQNGRLQKRTTAANYLAEDEDVEYERGCRNLASPTEDDEENSEIWFNAGLRAGVGIGLGFSIGIGLGIGLIAITYRSKAKICRKGWS